MASREGTGGRPRTGSVHGAGRTGRRSSASGCVALAAFAAVAGCGSGGTDLEVGTADPVAAFAAAVEGSKGVESGRFDVRTETSGGPLSMVMSGEGAWSGDRSELTVRVEGDGAGDLWGTESFAYVTTPSTVYVSGLGPALGSDAEWMAIDVADLGADGPEALGFDQALDPDALLGTLGVAAEDVEETGTGEVRGEPTTTYAVRTTLAEMLDGSLTAEERAQVEDVAGGEGLADLDQVLEVEVGFTVDVGADGLVRRIAMSWQLGEALADLPGAEDLGGMTTSQVVEFHDLGAEVAIGVPSQAEPFDPAERGIRTGPTGATTTITGEGP